MTNLPIRDMTEDDIRNIESLALDRLPVLNAVCKAMGIRLVASHYTRGEDSLTVTPLDGPAFTGTMAQVIAYVKGYSVAWRGGRSRMRSLATNVHRHMNEQLEKMTAHPADVTANDVLKYEAHESHDDKTENPDCKFCWRTA